MLNKLSHSSVTDACFELGVDSNGWLIFETGCGVVFVAIFLLLGFQTVVAFHRVVFSALFFSVLWSIVFLQSPRCPNSKIIKYADNAVFLHFLRSQTQDILHLEWNTLIKWPVDVSLPINFDKCKLKDFVTKKVLLLSPIYVSSGVTVKCKVCHVLDFSWC